MSIDGISRLRAQEAYARATSRGAGAALAVLAGTRKEVGVTIGPLSIRYETETAPDPRQAAREAAKLLMRVSSFNFTEALQTAQEQAQAYGAQSDVQSGVVPAAEVRTLRTPAAGARAYRSNAEPAVASMLTGHV